MHERRALARHIAPIVACFLLVSWSAGTTADDTETLETAGLTDTVEIIKDKWGVSHIYAKNQHDLFFAQGYNAARDRLFQFEIWRRRATGTLAEILGEKFIDHDEGARLLRYRGNIEEELSHYHEDGIEIVHAFVAGVNAYIELVSKDKNLLPPEFELLGIEPGLWTPEVVVSRHNALTGGIQTEIMLSETITELGEERTRQVLPFQREPNLVAKPGIDLSLISWDIYKLYSASRARIDFETSTPEVALRQTPLEWVETVGSNNWVIAGSRTASGKPIMANDPHRSVQIPSLRYIVHLNAPGWNVIGAGEPVLPGVSIGHNGFGAWGLTIFRIDQEDLYVYRTNPENADQYWFNGRWRDMEIEHITIEVKGQPAVSRVLRYAHHGPVLSRNEEENIAFGMQAVWLEKGAAPYLASLRMDQADSWSAFREACIYSGLPGENMVWADRDGHIGWQSVGYTPIRFGWEGRLPVTGDGTYDWRGMVPISAMPHLVDPEEGWYGTANHNNVPAHYPNIFADFYSDPTRSWRLNEVLNGVTGHTVEDSMRLQYDNKSMTAELLVPILLSLQPLEGLEASTELLGSWNYSMDRDSGAALIYDKWELEMLGALNQRVLPDQDELVRRIKLREWMSEPPEHLFGEEPDKARNALMLESFRAAVSSLQESFGEDVSQWAYGDVHVSHIEHPLSGLVGDEYDAGPLPRGGASNTLNANHGDSVQLAGGTFRIVVDTADWDQAVATNAPGQSGDPRSPFYANLYEHWNRGTFFPLLYSREKIEQAAAERLLLTPR